MIGVSQRCQIIFQLEIYLSHLYTLLLRLYHSTSTGQTDHHRLFKQVHGMLADLKCVRDEYNIYIGDKSSTTAAVGQSILAQSALLRVNIDYKATPVNFYFKPIFNRKFDPSKNLAIKKYTKYILLRLGNNPPKSMLEKFRISSETVNQTTPSTSIRRVPKFSKLEELKLYECMRGELKESGIEGGRFHHAYLVFEGRRSLAEIKARWEYVRTKSRKFIRRSRKSSR
jgi:hypothetical protein